jgi:hypothetical protein
MLLFEENASLFCAFGDSNLSKNLDFDSHGFQFGVDRCRALASRSVMAMLQGDGEAEGDSTACPRPPHPATLFCGILGQGLTYLLRALSVLLFMFFVRSMGVIALEIFGNVFDQAICFGGVLPGFRLGWGSTFVCSERHLPWLPGTSAFGVRAGSLGGHDRLSLPDSRSSLQSRKRDDCARSGRSLETSEIRGGQGHAYKFADFVAAAHLRSLRMSRMTSLFWLTPSASQPEPTGSAPGEPPNAARGPPTRRPPRSGTTAVI